MMRRAILAAIALGWAGGAQARDISGWERTESGLTSGMIGKDLTSLSLESRIIFLLSLFHLEYVPPSLSGREPPEGSIYIVRNGDYFLGSPPTEPTNVTYSATYATESSRLGTFYPGPNVDSREFEFRAVPEFEAACSALIERELATIITPEAMTALGMVVRNVPNAGNYTIAMQETDPDRYVHSKEVMQGFIWDERPWTYGRYYNSVIEPGQTIDNQAFSTGARDRFATADWVNEMQTAIQYRTDKGACTKRGSATSSVIELSIPLTLAAPGAKPVPKTAPPPKIAEPARPAPEGGRPTLTVTSAPPPKPPAPEAIVYKPSGERPKPPQAPKLPPCPPGPTACAVADGGPMTPEGLAYMEKARAYEIAIREFEAKEAAERQAVADLNKQRQQEYSANLAAIEKERSDALTARDAKIAADKAAYDAQLKAHQDETDRLAREHEAAMAEWRRKTAACLAGDMSQCANSGGK